MFYHPSSPPPLPRFIFSFVDFISLTSSVVYYVVLVVVDFVTFEIASPSYW